MFLHHRIDAGLALLNIDSFLKWLLFLPSASMRFSVTTCSPTICYTGFFKNILIIKSTKYSLLVVLICISLKTNNIGHLIIFITLINLLGFVFCLRITVYSNIMEVSPMLYPRSITTLNLGLSKMDMDIQLVQHYSQERQILSVLKFK